MDQNIDRQTYRQETDINAYKGAKCTTDNSNIAICISDMFSIKLTLSLSLTSPTPQDKGPSTECSQ